MNQRLGKKGMRAHRSVTCDAKLCGYVKILPLACDCLACMLPKTGLHGSSMQAMLQVTSMLLQKVICHYLRHGDGPLG